ncbi:c-type cytochrome [Pseudomonas saliphila]|uniref:c-type cytochrome n=1 Tax=Pseudomonas saliphila TaxID=2586906 RepID=UPI00123ACB4D|nr:c-type cytochrome [Pseudomonas saliphila]
MKRRDKSDNHLDQVDQHFEPWEPNQPIPLFVIALAFALAVWGALTYLSEFGAAHDETGPEAVQQASPDIPEASTAAEAQGLQNASPEVLGLVYSGKDDMWSCASCHGASGEGTASTPRLAGQVGDYLFKQLQDFHSGSRDDDNMAFVVSALNEDEMRDLADYYAQIRLPSRVAPTMGGDLERGRVLAESGDWEENVPACLQCHGGSGEGVEPFFPMLAGQHPEYTFVQLAKWHAGARGNSPQALMDGIAEAMSPEDMRAVSDFLATLPLRSRTQAQSFTGPVGE